MNKTKKNIFDSAIYVFSQNGFSEAKMDDIATKAGVAKGTLYYHFKSKEEIFNFIIVEGLNMIKEKLDEGTRNLSDPINKIKEICRLQLESVHNYSDLFKVIMSQIWGQENRQLELRKIIRDYIDFIEKFLIEAMNKGYIRKGNTNFMAYTFFGAICSAAVYDLINSEKVNNTSIIINNLTDYILRGLLANEQPNCNKNI